MSPRRGGGRTVGLVLLFLTFVLDSPSLLFRFPFGTGIGMLFGASESLALALGALFAVLPILRSIAVLTFGPVTRLFVHHSRGARNPSEREAARIRDALEACVHEGVRPPRHVWVIDAADMPAALVDGSSLFFQRDAIWSPYLAGVVAHELGHLNSIDQRMWTATRWANYSSLRTVARSLTEAKVPGLMWLALLLLSLQLRLLAGGDLPRLLNPAWRWWARQREFAADRFAASLGHGESLAAALEEQVPFDSASPWMRRRLHPYLELRIDRLRTTGGYGVGVHMQAASSGDKCRNA